jgi:site-specific DNA-methyltransferase (adenine-specific)
MKPYYDHAGVTLYHADHRDVLPDLPGPRSDDKVVVLTSPPYNLGNTSGGGMPGKGRVGHYSAEARMRARGGMGKWSGGSLADGYRSFNDSLPHEEYVKWQRWLLAESARLVGDAGAVFYNHKPRVLGGVVVTPFEYVPESITVRQVVIWARAGGHQLHTHRVRQHSRVDRRYGRTEVPPKEQGRLRRR